MTEALKELVQERIKLKEKLSFATRKVEEHVMNNFLTEFVKIDWNKLEDWAEDKPKHLQKLKKVKRSKEVRNAR